MISYQKLVCVTALVILTSCSKSYIGRTYVSQTSPEYIRFITKDTIDWNHKDEKLYSFSDDSFSIIELKYSIGKIEGNIKVKNINKTEKFREIRVVYTSLVEKTIGYMYINDDKLVRDDEIYLLQK
ncbi:MAG: hypothetical protein NTX59_08625 [Elusimicrobia bacterium]|nr:hypothetical protein [Elusimicrobiota bacterium]